jgi:hypothetical protein
MNHLQASLYSKVSANKYACLHPCLTPLSHSPFTFIAYCAGPLLLFCFVVHKILQHGPSIRMQYTLEAGQTAWRIACAPFRRSLTQGSTSLGRWRQFWQRETPPPPKKKDPLPNTFLPLFVCLSSTFHSMIPHLLLFLSFISPSLSIFIISLFLYLSIYFSYPLIFSFFLSVHLYIYLSIYLFIYLSIYPRIFLPVEMRFGLLVFLSLCKEWDGGRWDKLLHCRLRRLTRDPPPPPPNLVQSCHYLQFIKWLRGCACVCEENTDGVNIRYQSELAAQHYRQRSSRCSTWFQRGWQSKNRDIFLTPSSASHFPLCFPSFLIHGSDTYIYLNKFVSKLSLIRNLY